MTSRTIWNEGEGREGRGGQESCGSPAPAPSRPGVLPAVRALVAPQGAAPLRSAQLSSKPAAHSMAYSSLLRSSASSRNSGSLSRFMQVLAVGSRSRSEPPL